MTEYVLQANDITVTFGGLVAIDNVSVSIRKGTIQGLIGPNGAGKTTFFNVLTGLVQHSVGSVVFCGEDITLLATHIRATRGMRRSFQSVQLVPSMTGLENVLIGLHSELIPKNSRAIFKLFFGESVDRRAIDMVWEVAEFLGIAHTLDTPVSEVSFADQRFIEIARAVVSNPALLMLDEPAAGLSEAEIVRLDSLLRKLVEQKGLSILLVEHVLSLVLGISEEITVLDNGRLIAHGTPEEIAANDKVKSAYLGEESDA